MKNQTPAQARMTCLAVEVRAMAKESGLTRAQVAEKLSIGTNTAGRLFNGGVYSVSTELLARFADVCGYDLKVTLAPAGILGTLRAYEKLPQDPLIAQKRDLEKTLYQNVLAWAKGLAWTLYDHGAYGIPTPPWAQDECRLGFWFEDHKIKRLALCWRDEVTGRAAEIQFPVEYASMSTTEILADWAARPQVSEEK